MNREADIHQLMNELAQSRRSITRWVTAGCPHTRLGGKRGKLLFDIAEVRAWMAREDMSGDVGTPPSGQRHPVSAPTPGLPPAPAGVTPATHVQSQTRTMHLVLKHLEVKKRQREEEAETGRLRPVEEFDRFWSIAVTTLHSSLRSIPDRVARKAGVHYDAVREEAEAAIKDALRPFGRDIPWQ